MQLHELKHSNSNNSKKRVGRGGARGSYSGKGMKGQKSRAGKKIRPAIRDLMQRTPKRRGIADKTRHHRKKQKAKTKKYA